MGRRVAGYDLGERLAMGGMAEVFLATRVRDGRPVVIKKMLPQLASDASFVRRFVAEGELARHLKNPHIVEIVEMVAVGDELMMVMEAIDGADLITLIKRCLTTGLRFPLRVALRIGHALADALTCAHEATDEKGKALAIIHRDVTPSNVLIGRDGAIKLIDFGIARASTFDHHTRSGYLVGKIHYLAPEQVNNVAIDSRVDIWSAGCVLFHLLALRRPFDGLSEPAILMKIATGERPDIRALCDVPEDVAAVVDRALGVELADRFASARELRDTLARVIAAHKLQSPPRELAAFVEELVPSEAEDTAYDTASAVKQQLKSLALDNGAPLPVDVDAVAARVVGRDDDKSVTRTTPERPSSTEAATVLLGDAVSDGDDTARHAPAPPPRRRDVTQPAPRPLPVDAPTLTSTAPKPTTTTTPTTPTARPRPLWPIVVGGMAGSFALGVVVTSLLSAAPATTTATTTTTTASPPPQALSTNGEGGVNATSTTTTTASSHPQPLSMNGERGVSATSTTTTTASPPPQPLSMNGEGGVSPTSTASPHPQPLSMNGEGGVNSTSTTSPHPQPLSMNGEGGVSATSPTSTTTTTAPPPPQPLPTNGEGGASAPSTRTTQSDDAKRRPRPAAVGSVVIDSRPWSRVFVDGDDVGLTPATVKNLKVGKHRVVLKNDEQGLSKSTTVTVTPNEVTRLRVDLKR